MCKMNPSCKLKEKLIYMVGSVKLYACKCGMEWGENPDEVVLSKNQQIKFENALEDYYKEKN